MSNNNGNDARAVHDTGKGKDSGRESLKTHIRKIARPALMLATAMVLLVIISYTGLRLLLPEDKDISTLTGGDEQQAVIEKGRTELLDAERIAYFTRILNLSTEEAKLFWPVYNEFTDKREKISKERGDIIARAKQYKGQGGAPEEWGDRLISLEMEEAVLKAEYHKKFKQILSGSRLIMLYYAEDSFKDYMLERLRSRQQ